MATDLATQDMPPTLGAIPIDRLVQEAVPDYGVDTAKMKSDLTGIAREKVAATDTAVERQLEAQKSNYSELKDKLAGVGPLNAQPWDADKEKADRVRSPLEDFGSTAGIFAMIASAFTRTPLDNALNAGAAAINGARANDFDGYEKAHTAWKENTDLAIKNHEIERQAFKDAEELYKNDPVAGGAELKAVAARFGAKAELAMIDAGYVDKVFEIQKSKSEAAQKLLQQLPQLAALDETTRTQMLYKKGIEEAAQRNGGQMPDAIEQARIMGNVKRLVQQSMGTFTAGKQEALAIQDRADELIREAQGRGETLTSAAAYARAAREVGTEKAHLTAGQADKIKNHINLIDESSRVIENVEKTIEKYVGAAGVASRPLRVKERLSNLVGSNQTDRVQMARDIEYLRLNAPRLLTDSPGHPLAADVKRIDAIVAGLEWGDTGANTLRAMEEIKGIYKRSREAAVGRLNNTWNAGPTGGAPAPVGSETQPTQSGRPNPWDADPIIK